MKGQIGRPLTTEKVELIKGKPNYLAEKNNEIKARTQQRLMKSDFLRKITSNPAPAVEKEVPISMFEDDYLHPSTAALQRTADRSNTLLAMKSSTFKHLHGVSVPSIFTQESILQRSEPG